MSDKLFKGLLIGVISIVVICAAVIVIYTHTTGSSNNSSGSVENSSKSQDPSSKVDTSQIKALSPNTVWNQNTVLGNPNAEHKLVVYSDLFCPYCRKEFEAIRQNMSDFKSTYLDTNKVSYELRITDLLTDPSDSTENYDSTTGGEVVHAAAMQGHFWDYMDAVQDKIYADYYSKGFGDRHRDRTTEPDWKKHLLPALSTSYFTDIAATVPGIDMTKLNNAISDGSAMKELKQYSKSASAAGVHSFPDFFIDGKEAKELYGIDNSYDYGKFYSNIKKGLAVKGIT